MDILQQVREWAAQRHAEANCTYGVHDFTYHLNAVENVLLRFGHDSVYLRTVAHLHDVVEDTSTALDEIGQRFGMLVMAGVDALTDVTHDMQGDKLPNRRARQQATYAKLRGYCTRNGSWTDLAFQDLRQVINVKLADRIANVEASMAGINSRHYDMYVVEHPFFCREVGQVGGDEAMWTHLDKLVTKNPLLAPARRLKQAYTDGKFDDIPNRLADFFKVVP